MPPTDVDRVSLLLGTSLFDDLSPAELEPLARAASIRRVVRGEHVFEAGDPADALYIVASGQLRDAIYSDEGAEITHSLWEPGQCFGEVGFFAPSRTRVMSVLALEPSTLLILGREPLTAFLERHPSVAMKLLEKMATTSQWQTGMFLTLARRPLADQVVLRLLDLRRVERVQRRGAGDVAADLAVDPCHDGGSQPREREPQPHRPRGGGDPPDRWRSLPNPVAGCRPAPDHCRLAGPRAPGRSLTRSGPAPAR